MLIDIPTLEGVSYIEIEPARPVVLLGPNGSGKTRLGIYVDDLDALGASHRIAAQRSLELPDGIFLENFDQAVKNLRRDKTKKQKKSYRQDRWSTLTTKC